MRILCLTARLPFPPDRGDRLRAYNFINSLARQHEIHLLSFISSISEIEHVETLKMICSDVRVVKRSKFTSILNAGINSWRPTPLQVLYYSSRQMHLLVRSQLTRYSFDMAYIHLFRMAPYLENIRGLYRIVDLTDVISREILRSLPFRNLLARLIYSIEAHRIQKFEQKIPNQFEEIWLISEADRMSLEPCLPLAHIEVIGNGINTAIYYPTGESPEPYSIVFTGHLNVFHNIDAAILLARQVLPIVQQVFPTSKLYIVGADPSSEVLKLNTLPGVKITGYVPDLNNYLNKAAVFVAPLRFAAGVQNKVIEAMAAARPIVTTSIVNEGIGAINGEHLILADTPLDTANQIITLFSNAARAHDLGQAAYHFAIKKYSWDHVLERVNQIALTISG